MIATNEIFKTHSAPGQFVNFESDDRNETEAFATSLFCPHEFRLARREKSLSARIATASLSSLSLASIGFRADVSIDPGTLDTFYLVQTVVAGTVDILSGDKRCSSTPGVATVISPNQATRMLWDKNAHFLSLKIERTALEKQLSDLIGEPVGEPVVFDLKLDLNRDETKTWQSAVDTLYNLLRHTDWRPGDICDAQLLERWIITTLLHTQPHNYSTKLSVGKPADWPQSLRRAVRFVDRNFKRDISARQLALASGVSERKIRGDFSKYVGMTFKHYQLSLRLRYVRSVLREARHDTSVTNVIADAGVQHFGRFSSYYQEEFGELPSSTLTDAKSRL